MAEVVAIAIVIVVVFPKQEHIGLDGKHLI